MYKNLITNIKLEELLKTDDYELCARHLQLKQLWILPQAIAYVAQHWKPQRTGELYSALKTLEQISSPWERGLYLMLTRLNRGLLVQKQADVTGAQYCSLVPLILLAYKLHYDIPYSMWDRSELKYIVHQDLCDAMLHQPPQLQIDELLDLRTRGLTIMTGEKSGQQKPPQTTWRLYNLSSTPLGQVPKLQQVMLTQIWCAHPQWRHSNMVLDPTTWDLMPEPLISDEIFSEPKKVAKAGNNVNGLGSDYILPWMVK